MLGCKKGWLYSIFKTHSHRYLVVSMQIVWVLAAEVLRYLTLRFLHPHQYNGAEWISVCNARGIEKCDFNVASLYRECHSVPATEHTVTLFYRDFLLENVVPNKSRWGHHILTARFLLILSVFLCNISKL